jgi:hypothetical protein
MSHLSLCTLALAAMTAHAAGTPPELPVRDLKVRYLECDRLATRTVLDFGTAAHCSLVAEALLQRGFDGRFEDLLAWWKQAKREPVGLAPSADAHP